MSERITFLSAIIGRSMILALRAALSPSVLWRTLRCGLPADMILQKRPTRFAKNNPKIFLLGHIKIITAVKRLFQNRDKKYHNAVHNNTKSNNPNTADLSHRH